MGGRITDITSLTSRLRDAAIHYDFERIRDDGVAVVVAVPGERWEIDFLTHGSVNELRHWGCASSVGRGVASPRSLLRLLHIHAADQPVVQPIDVNHLLIAEELPVARAHDLADGDG